MEAFDKCGLASRIRDLVIHMDSTIIALWGQKASLETKKEFLILRRKWELLLPRECLNLIDKDQFWERQGVIVTTTITQLIDTSAVDKSSLPPACACIDGASCSKHGGKNLTAEKSKNIHSTNINKTKYTLSSSSVLPALRPPSIDEVRIVRSNLSSVEKQQRGPLTQTQHFNHRKSKSPTRSQDDSEISEIKIIAVSSGAKRLVTKPKKPAAETKAVVDCSDSDDDIVILSDDESDKVKTFQICRNIKAVTSSPAKKNDDVILISDSEFDSEGTTDYLDNAKEEEHQRVSQSPKRFPSLPPIPELTPVQLVAPYISSTGKSSIEDTIEKVSRSVDSFIPIKRSKKRNKTNGFVSVSPPVGSSEPASDDVIIIEDSDEETNSKKKQTNSIEVSPGLVENVVDKSTFQENQALPIPEKKRKRKALLEERNFSPGSKCIKIRRTKNSPSSTATLDGPPVLNLIGENKSNSAFVDYAVPGAKEPTKGENASKLKEPPKSSKKTKTNQTTQRPGAFDDLINNLLAPTLTNFEIVFDNGVATTKFTHL